MTKSETVLMFALIKSLFPRDEAFKNATPDMVVAWAEMLEDIPFEHAKAAIKASVATSPFPPSISEIRDYATRLNGPRRLTAEEAWGIASDVIRTYGNRTIRITGYIPIENKPARFGEPVRIRPSGLEYEAKRHCPEDVWKLLERMGYPDLCASENPDVIRGQFMRAWASHDQEAREARVLGAIVPELVKAITGEMFSRLEGRKEDKKGDETRDQG